MNLLYTTVYLLPFFHLTTHWSSVEILKPEVRDSRSRGGLQKSVVSIYKVIFLETDFTLSTTLPIWPFTPCSILQWRHQIHFLLFLYLISFASSFLCKLFKIPRLKQCRRTHYPTLLTVARESHRRDKEVRLKRKKGYDVGINKIRFSLQN